MLLVVVETREMFWGIEALKEVVGLGERGVCFLAEVDWLRLGELIAIDMVIVGDKYGDLLAT